MTQPANPPAFPTFEVIDQWDKDREKYREAMLPAGGMSLRDYFAAKVVARLIPDHVYSCATVAEEAYQLADAMLRARERQE